MPARFTEVPQGPVTPRTPVARSQGRAERRAEQMAARRARRRWSVFSFAVLGCAFGLTVGILDVLH